MKSSLILGSIFATSALADVCNHDNVLRCLIGSSAVASPYCSSYISIPVVTTTVTAFIPVTTITTTTTILSTYSTTTTSTAATTTVPIYVKQDSKIIAYNHAGNRIPAITARALAATSPAPQCLSQVSSTLYPASRISSACSCLSVLTSTNSVTATAPTSTSTVRSYTSSTASTTLVTVTTSTQTISPKITCSSVTGGNYPYNRYYKGSSFTENYNNPGNVGVSNFLPVVQNYPASQDVCTAATNCTAEASILPEIYYSFDLYFLTSQNQWECVLFYNGNSDPSYFNVPNSDAAMGYGYTIQL